MPLRAEYSVRRQHAEKTAGHSRDESESCDDEALGVRALRDNGNRRGHVQEHSGVVQQLAGGHRADVRVSQQHVERSLLRPTTAALPATRRGRVCCGAVPVECGDRARDRDDELDGLLDAARPTKEDVERVAEVALAHDGLSKAEWGLVK